VVKQRAFQSDAEWEAFKTKDKFFRYVAQD
jgi:hypothetical protein